jgi:putative ABC transport system ATP-binding protein
MSVGTAPEVETLPTLEEEALPVPAHLKGAFAVLLEGLRGSPALRRGLGFTVIISLGQTVVVLLLPILIQQVFDHGFDGGFRPRFVFSLCAVAGALVVLSYVAARAAARRLVQASEEALMEIRIRAFRHIHGLSIATQSREKRGVFVARVTADVDTLSQFTEWGGIAWIVSAAQILGAFVLMVFYSWQLTIPVVLLVAPLLLAVWRLQSALSAAFDLVRARVGQMLSEVSESVMGADVVRAYGLEVRIDSRVKRSIRQRYDAQVVAHKRTALLYPMSTVFWGLELCVVILVGVTFGPGWGLTFGRVSAFLFLADMFLHPFTDLPEIYAETQTAIAGWRKILALLALPVDVVEPADGRTLPNGALDVRAEDVDFAYGAGEQGVRGAQEASANARAIAPREQGVRGAQEASANARAVVPGEQGPLVLHEIDLFVPAGAHVAVVGETGSGKSTFVRLLARLADPVRGRILIGGADLRDIAPESRRRAIRIVPQDGFLFDMTILENVRAGREGATDRDVEVAFEELGLGEWLGSLPNGGSTRVGERGEALSVGERQLVSLVRAQIGDPGVLVLDEATSAVDPATERRISEALRRVSAGRTTITIAHRLSTAETADTIFVFDRGRIVERGTHDELVAAGGRYATLYASWLGNVRAARPGAAADLQRP